MRTWIIFTFLLTSPALAGVPFSTKDHIGARGVSLSFILPDGMTKVSSDAFLGLWLARTQGVQVSISLSMYKHHMHTHGEKVQTLTANEYRPFYRKVQSKRLKIGNEPAVLNEYRTPDEDIKDGVHCVELWLHPGDTTIHLNCQISQNGASAETMANAVRALVPMLIKMLENAKLDD